MQIVPLVLSLLWIGVILLFIIVMLKKFTFGDKKSFRKETLCFPPGTFRAIMAISLLFLTMISLLYNPITIDKLLELFGMVVAFYFGGNIIKGFTGDKKDGRKDSDG